VVRRRHTIGIAAKPASSKAVEPGSGTVAAGCAKAISSTKKKSGFPLKMGLFDNVTRAIN
jgi:hypothetical protein